ncbi:hypothetical protein [Thauera chlorobenzoica]|uniref:Uncharacterized protein n=1 Tax=Thauera chlorobenzoica TaxID=96773 RepID=A0A1H5SHQ4_9RHOO|nr:hypothetical protein [Thauera chlorobenzoica]APR04783.1 hypothetical protein Tchl_1936 [Thauera chlorobenzoica]SEF50152.1 hypothetical protein SAMN05216242_101541 [Thauera chlorobenzoica]
MKTKVNPWKPATSDAQLADWLGALACILDDDSERVLNILRHGKGHPNYHGVLLDLGHLDETLRRLQLPRDESGAVLHPDAAPEGVQPVPMRALSDSGRLALAALGSIGVQAEPAVFDAVAKLTDHKRFMVEPTRELWLLVDLTEHWLLRAERQGVDVSAALAADHLAGLAQAILELAERGSK